MRYEDKRVFIILQVAGQPDDVLMIQIVGRFVEDQDRRVFEQQFDQQDLGPLTAGKIRNVLVQTDITQPQTSRDFLDLGVQLIKAAVFEDLLDLAGVFHHFIHFVRVFRKRHILIELQHFTFQIVHMVKGCVQDLADRHAFFEHRVLVQIADRDMAGPGDLACIRQDLAGDDVQKCGFSFAVRTDQTDVLAFEQAKGCVL